MESEKNLEKSVIYPNFRGPQWAKESATPSGLKVLPGQRELLEEKLGVIPPEKKLKGFAHLEVRWTTAGRTKADIPDPFNSWFVKKNTIIMWRGIYRLKTPIAHKGQRGIVELQDVRFVDEIWNQIKIEVAELVPTRHSLRAIGMTTVDPIWMYGLLAAADGSPRGKWHETRPLFSNIIDPHSVRSLFLQTTFHSKSNFFFATNTVEAHREQGP